MPPLTRRRWAALLAVTPALAQVTSTAPPQGTPAPQPDLDKAIDEVRSSSKRLAAIEVPMNVEPAFSFKA